MAWTQQTTNAAASHTLTLAVTAGDLIFVGLGWGSGTLSDLTSITDDASNSYTLFTGAADAGNSQSSRGGWAIAGTTATITITGNGISGFGFKFANAVSYRESGTISFIGQNQAFNSFSTSTDAINSGNITPSAVDDLIICFVQNTGFGPLTLDPGTGYTLSVADAANPSRVCLTEYKIATSTSAQAATATQSNASSVALFVTVFHATGGASPTTTIVTGNAVAAVGIPEPYLYKLDADPGASTVNVTPTAPVAGSFSASPLALTTSNWNTGLSSSLTASAAGSGNVSSTNDGALANGNLAITVHPVARPSAVTPGTYTDETGAALVVGKINDGSDATGAKDAAGADYTALLFDLSAIKSAGPQIAYFRGKEFAPGKRWRAVYYGADGVTVVGTGSWKTMTGTVAQYSDSLTLTGDAYKGQIQKQSNVGGSNSLSFPSNVTGSDTAAPFVALQFLNPQSDGLPIWGTGSGASRLGVTYIWRYRPRQQTGYYVNFWWSNNGSFLWDGGGSNTYYGGHPYPQSANNTGTTHYWEIAGGDSGSDMILTLAGTPRTVVQDVWYTQALRVIVNGDGSKTLRYYLDLPNLANTDIIQKSVLSTWGETNPPSPALTWGDSPWYASFQHECLSGELDSLKICAKGLSEADTVSEAGDMSTMVTTDGGNYVWYSKNGFDSVDDLTCPYTSRTPVWADTGNKATLGDRP